jgi:hypothetical protein
LVLVELPGWKVEQTPPTEAIVYLLLLHLSAAVEAAVKPECQDKRVVPAAGQTGTHQREALAPLVKATTVATAKIQRRLAAVAAAAAHQRLAQMVSQLAAARAALERLVQ